MTGITYRESGVDIEKGDLFVDLIKKQVGLTHHFHPDALMKGVGGYASLFKLDEKRALAAATDGVGTKILLAHELDSWETVGIDLVAMSINDLICVGARPLFFLDYLATGKLDPEKHLSVVKGIVEGCKQSECILIGGETAEMPGMYQGGHLDLAGFAVGEVDLSSEVLPMKEGDSLIGLSSSGFHSNGYSLVRRLLENEDISLKKKCLEPTKIYHSQVKFLKEKLGSHIKTISHITGGGLKNLPRLSHQFNYLIDGFPALEQTPEVFSWIRKKNPIGLKEYFSTLNMGIGLIFVTDAPKKALSLLEGLGEEAYLLGKIEKGDGEVRLAYENEEVSFRSDI